MIAKLAQSLGLCACGFVSTVTLAVPDDFPDRLQRIKQSVVVVASYQPMRTPPMTLLGTAFAVGDGSLLATSMHVVDKEFNLEERERLVIALKQDGEVTISDVSVVKTDRQHDMALLRANRSLPPLTISSREVREGEELVFTGFPIANVLGIYPVTHRGMVSSVTPIVIPVSKSGQLTAEKIRRLRKPTFVYQLDATAYPGNSGSPLYDPATSEVVGILNQVHVKRSKEDVLSDPSGISYAIPITHLVRLLESIR